MLRRMTTQKKIVYNTIDVLGHTNVEDLIHEIQSQHQKISLATIYRNIQVLLQEGKIKRIQLKNQDILETIKEDHCHFVCERCGRIWDMDGTKKNMVLEASKDCVHQIKQCDVTFYGLCQDCKN